MPEKVKYNFSDDPSGVHMIILDEIKNNSTILDIGCASGYMGEFLIKEKGCRVWGIEPDVNSAAKAKSGGYDIVINKGVEAGMDGIEAQFDYIIMADVLEHLVEPGKVLENAKMFLKPGGKILISLPNVAHYSIRLKLLSGKWEMHDWGILDKTHLHFYALDSAKALLEGAGLKIEKLRPRGDLERWFRRIRLEKIGRKILFFCPKIFAIQFVFITKVD